jgi:predicted metalloprotease with PDZ domain
MRVHLLVAVVCSVIVVPLTAQHPLRHFSDAIEARYDARLPDVTYRLTTRAGDTTGFDVELEVRSAPDTLRLAMAAHPEYDDRYWRYVEHVTAATAAGPQLVAREDSAVWRISTAGRDVTVRYRLQLPPSEPFREAWRPFLAPTGGLVGGPHSLMYVVGATLNPVHLILDIPAAWQAATGLEPTVDPRIWYAPSAGVLLDSPVLVGRLRNWGFDVGGVPHRIAYWPASDVASFDTVAFAGGVERIAREAIALFGRAPYRDYTFLMQDASYGALEHANSVTIGVPGSAVAKDPAGSFEEIAHEYFHAWNLMRIRPAEYGDLDFRPSRRSSGLWWSEGITMYYADVLLRRAGLPVEDSTRLAHLEALISRFLASTGNSTLSPERVSRATYGAPEGALGDNLGSVHTQGELIGTLLDLTIRDSTGGRRSLDDLMRLMMRHFSGPRGFTGADIERTTAAVCECDLHAFFEAHVRAARPFAFDPYLRGLGLRANVDWIPQTQPDGSPSPDLRVWAWHADDGTLRLHVFTPRGAWARAGLHTGDRLLAVGGHPVSTSTDFRTLLAGLHLGDTIAVNAVGPAGPKTATVILTGYLHPRVRLVNLGSPSAAQLAARERWMAARP